MKKFTFSVLALAFVGVLNAEVLKGEKMQEKQVVVSPSEFESFKGDEKIFSGDVKVSMMFKSTSYYNFSAGLVEFSPGARSAWHTHPAGQNLIVVEGEILTSTKDGVAQIAKKGDVILCPPDIEHFHGATDTQKGAHIALTPELNGKNVNWLKKVSDAEYKKALEEARK